MSLLLDTHPLVWFLVDPKLIPTRPMTLLTDPSRIVRVSAVAIREATIKTGLGRLALPLDRIEATIALAGFTVLAVAAAHALEVRQLPARHHDPFDRLLIAQARHERLSQVTPDAVARSYPVDTLWDWVTRSAGRVSGTEARDRASPRRPRAGPVVGITTAARMRAA